MRVPVSLSYLASAVVVVGGAVAALVHLGPIRGGAHATSDDVARTLVPAVAPCEGDHANGEACKAELSPAANPHPGAAGSKGEVLASGTPQLLEFEAAYCSACASMAPVVKAVVSSCAKAAASVKHVDVESDKGEAIARRYEVASLPTFIAVDADGREVFRRVGVQPPKEIASILAEVTGENCVVD